MTTSRLSCEDIEELKQLASAHFWPHGRQAGDMSEETGVKFVNTKVDPIIKTARGLN